MLLCEEEFFTLKDIVSKNAARFADIHGVFITGSLVQKVGLPSPPKTYNLNPLSRAYAGVVGRTRRKLFPHIDSDFDFWILTKEQPGNEGLPKVLSEAGHELLEWYAAQEKPNLAEWIHLKKRKFDSIYKKGYLYSNDWIAQNPTPCEAGAFKNRVESDIVAKLPELVSKVNYYFKKKLPGNFIEARAFPASVFNLKTERIPVGTEEDRTPFPFYLRDWVDLDRNCIVLYKQEGAENLIYPFNRHGAIPGQELAKSIGWTPRHIDFVLYNSAEEIGNEPFRRL